MDWMFLVLIPFLTEASASVAVVYLRGVTRLNDPSYKDYYFCCNSVGHTLQWEVNESGLGGFIAGNVAGVVHGTRPNYNYTTTLLSSAATTGGLYTFDSVLIVSVKGNLLLNVTCSNGPTSNNTDNSGEQHGIADEDKTENGSVLLERVLTRVIVNRTSTITPTSIFICGVDNVHMNWETTSSNYGFSTFDRAGSRRQNLDIGEITVSQQAVFLCTEPYKLVTVFFATGDSDVVVTCGYPQDYVQLSSRYFTLSTSTESDGVAITSNVATTSEDEPETSSRSSITTGDSVMLEAASGSSKSAAANAVIIAVLVCLCCFIDGITITDCCIYKKCRETAAEKTQMESKSMHMQPPLSMSRYVNLYAQ